MRKCSFASDMFVKVVEEFHFALTFCGIFFFRFFFLKIAGARGKVESCVISLEVL